MKINTQHSTNIYGEVLPPDPKLTKKIVEFYEDATDDYRTWSPKMHMHYGYLRKLSQFFRRETMLDEMVRQSIANANLDENSHVIDLGCGVGTSLRLINQWKGSRGTGVTISGGQVDLGRSMSPSGEQLNLLCADYHFLPFPDRLFDHAIALESICHSPDKQKVIHEAFRVIKPGGTITVTDCFRKRTTSSMNRLTRWGYDRFRNDWAVPDLDRIDFFVQRLKKAGFTDIEVKNISARVAPSLLYSPILVLKFALGKLFTTGRIGKASRKNLEAVLLSIIIGLNQQKFGYYVVRARKPEL